MPEVRRNSIFAKLFASHTNLQGCIDIAGVVQVYHSRARPSRAPVPELHLIPPEKSNSLFSILNFNKFRSRDCFMPSRLLYDHLDNRVRLAWVARVEAGLVTWVLVTTVSRHVAGGGGWTSLLESGGQVSLASSDCMILLAS